jgi:hypothetical protein
MRALRLLPVGLALMAGTLGCHAINCTAGICDCNPPAVESVLVPPAHPYPVVGTPPAPVRPAEHPPIAPVIKLPPANPQAPGGQFPDRVPPLEPAPPPMPDDALPR